MPALRKKGAQMADVFISYSKSHAALTRELAHELETKGLTVWWDTDLLAGESFRERIVQEHTGKMHIARAEVGRNHPDR